MKLIVMPKVTEVIETVLYVRFGMRTEDADHGEQHLIANGVEIESRVTWEKDDNSIYFRDPDNYLVELITSAHWSCQPEHR